MNNTQSESKQQTVDPTQPTGIARRRLLRAGMAGVPVALTLSGRSAMAGTTCGDVKGLSPMAWASMAPNGTCVGTSHTINGNTLGKSPGLWKPNCGERAHTFQAPMWPVAPFDKVTTKVKVDNVWTSVEKTWGAWPYLNFKGVAADDPGFANGAKFNSVFVGGDDRSFSRILLDETAEGNVVWHFSAAYLNCLAYGTGYAIRLDELVYLYQNRKLAAGAIALSDSQIKDFLDQTWGEPT